MKIYKKLCLVAVALTCAVINYSGCANGFGSNSAAEVKELENVYNILGHSQQLMTEIGLCTGIDYTGYGPTEASCVQIAFHIGVNLDLTNSFRTEAAITKYIELGGSEALIY